MLCSKGSGSRLSRRTARCGSCSETTWEDHSTATRKRTRWAQGHAMTLQQAIAYALTEEAVTV